MNQRRHLCVFAMVALLGSATFALDAQAQSDETLTEKQRAQKHDELVAQGKAIYKEGKLEESLELFEQAYVLKEDPKLLFNMGIISERLGRIEDAVAYYDRFVVSPGLGLKARSKGQERLNVLRPIVEAQQRKSQERARLKRQRRREQEEAALRREQLMKSGAAVGSQEESSDASLYAGYGLIGLGAVAMGVGGVMLLTLEEEDAFIQQTSPDARRQARDDRQTSLTAGVVLTAGGALMVGLGATLWSLHSDEEPAKTAWRLTPALSPTQAGVLLEATF